MVIHLTRRLTRPYLLLAPGLAIYTRKSPGLQRLELCHSVEACREDYLVSTPDLTSLWVYRLSDLQALENAKSNDLLFWASRYNLFVLWSADRTHPWDSMPGAANHATLEIGKQRGSDSEVCGLHLCPLLPSG